MTVLHYLEKTADTFPNKVAVTDEHGSYTFSKLRDCALSIAAHINKRLSGRTHLPVLVYLPKGRECIASFMGILYSGNMYTPTDVRFPFPKVKSIIDVLKPALYISNGKSAQTLYSNGISSEDILIYEDISEGDLVINTDEALLRLIDTDPVYVFFTSGSTGVPKGVIMPHRGVIDFIEWAVNKFNIDENHIIGNQAPFYFDQSMPDVYLCIKTGACLCIIPERLFSFPHMLPEYLADNEINFINWVPSALCHVANQKALDNAKLMPLCKVLFCGEIMPNKQLNYWRKRYPDVLYVNLYGPTEAAHSCTHYIVNREFSDDEPLPIGIADENSDVFLLDSENRLIEDINRQGEICIRGSSLAFGYWDNPEKTSEAFCQNPLNTHYSETIYKTGDLAHYNDKNELMYDGRKDSQIKHLGYRIELGEIETAAISLDAVTTISADYDSNKQEIVLFYSGSIDAKSLQRALYKLLPKYMVPTRYFHLKVFPYNDNGKIDRLQLRTQMEDCKLDKHT